MDSIRVKRGLKQELPKSLPIGELAFCTDSKELFVGMGDNLALKKVVDPEVIQKQEELGSQMEAIVKYDVVSGLGCDNTGNTEIGDIIQTFLDNETSNKINLYFPPGNYKWNVTVSTNKTLYIYGERGNVTIVNSGNLACIKHSGNCSLSGLTFSATSSNRTEFTVYSLNGNEFLCYDTTFTCNSAKINGIEIEGTVISHIDRCKFNHSQISLKTWDVKITNTWVWALWRPYGIGIHGGCGNITISNVDVVPPYRTSSGDMQSTTLLDGIKAGIWINSENGNPTNNVILENIYLDGNPQLNTGIGILAEKVFGISVSTFRANKMSDYPIVIDSCYNVIVSKGVFFENNKLDLEKNEILVRKTYTSSKHDNINISDNQFINYKTTYTKPTPAIKVETDAQNLITVKYNTFGQNTAKAYGNYEISMPTMEDLSTNIPSGFAYKIKGSFTVPSGQSGVSVTLPRFMVIAPSQGNFRCWVDNGILPEFRIQKNTNNNVWVALKTAPTSDITINYEVTI